MVEAWPAHPHVDPIGSLANRRASAPGRPGVVMVGGMQQWRVPFTELTCRLEN
jgi:hypothetical protein